MYGRCDRVAGRRRLTAVRIKAKGASEPGKECGGTEKSHPQADNNGSLNLAGRESAATLRLARAVKDRTSGQHVSKHAIKRYVYT